MHAANLQAASTPQRLFGANTPPQAQTLRGANRNARRALSLSHDATTKTIAAALTSIS